MTDVIISYFRRCTDLQGFSARELGLLASISKLVSFAKGRDVFSIEHQDKYLFVVGEGMLSLRLHHRHMSKKFTEGALFGEITLFSDRGRLGAIHCLEEVELVAIDKQHILEATAILPDALRFKFLHCMGAKMASYFYHDQNKTISELLQEMESEYLEFKASTAEGNWDGMIRTVASFMNLNGGTILCGVKDGSGELAYFLTDKHKVDVFERKFRSKMHEHLGQNLPGIHFDLQQMGKSCVVRIDVDPSSFPVFYRKNLNNPRSKEYFYIRSGNQNFPIQMTSDIVRYIQRRFKTKSA